MKLPKMVSIKQNFPHQRLEDVTGTVREELRRCGLAEKIKPGQKVGVTAGSRGITNITDILSEVVKFIKSLDAKPEIIAAMGSHGGGTDDGQRQILDALKITEDNVGAPVRTGAECKQVGVLDRGVQVYVTEIARQCDAIVVVNRVKEHTAFHGPAESGLQKMITIGLGGPEGARTLHRSGAMELHKIIPDAARLIMDNIPIVMGLAILEDAHKDTMKIKALPPEQFAAGEEKLLNEARKILPRLPVNNLDLLIVEKMGKNYSGTGMDTNVIGRMRIMGVHEPEQPRIQHVAVLDLTDETHGNANGIGLADFTTRRLVSKIDWDATIKNVVTSTFIKRAMQPITLPDDRATIETALESLGYVQPEEARVMHIKNTLQLTDMRASTALLAELRQNQAVEIVGHPEELEFDWRSRLVPLP
ncbi:MAG: hypothetical protein VR67_08520 [Peptococcaceae bacterium BRH_c8a]|nr:MAG: hypothetical protein VR67_08520 [Peptococcaceae bacterium BRH_c8a]